jgi:DNA (cytosine-5)-methyltransferase 1
MPLTSLELCAGAGGQALGLEQAGYEHVGLVEIDRHCCETLRLNRPHWNVIETDLNIFDARPFKGVDLVAGGVPCPPFSKAGKQLGAEDERNLFPAAINVVKQVRPRAVMFENVRGLMDAVFDDYRKYITGEIRKLGYEVDWRLLNASDFGVPQLRPRVVMVGIRKDCFDHFEWPHQDLRAPTVGEALFDLMAENNWRGAKSWKNRADDIAPTLVGGSKRHGGPDLGPTRAKKSWAALGVDGHGIADQVPDRNFVGMPRLTTRMAARIQGFPDEWQFAGRKTATYRQIGNAFPPPVAFHLAQAISEALLNAEDSQKSKRKSA